MATSSPSTAPPSLPTAPDSWPALIDPAATLPVITRATGRKAEWHLASALSRLPDPCTRQDLFTAITGVLRPLDWRAEGARLIDAALSRLWNLNPIPDTPPEPAPEPPGKWGKAYCANIECGRQFVLKSSVQLTCSPKCRRRKSVLRRQAMKAAAV